MSYKFLFIFIIAGLLISCEPQNKYPGFKKIDNNFYFQLHKFEDENNRIFKEYVIADMKITDSSGKVIQYISPYEPVKVKSGKHYEKVYRHIKEGDSATFLFDTSFVLNDFLPKEMGDYGKRKPPSPIKLCLKVKEQLTKEQYFEFIHNREMQEQIELKRYFKAKNIDSSGYFKGIHVIKEKSGTGNKVSNGKVVYMHYRGEFLNSTPFDSTHHLPGPFEYTYGTPGQVIKGLEIGISKLRGGDKAKIIIPSQLAFGKEGSSTGIVPPYTALIYKVELLKVK